MAMPRELQTEDDRNYAHLLTLLSVSAFYQPLAVGIIVVFAALIMRYQR